MTMTWRVIVKRGGAVVVLPVVVIAVMGRRADMSCSRCEFLALLVLGMARITRAISYPPNQLAADFTALQYHKPLPHALPSAARGGCLAPPSEPAPRFRD